LEDNAGHLLQVVCHKKRTVYVAATKIRWVEKAKKLLVNTKHPSVSNQLIFFSDEKNFTQDQKVNRRNNRRLCSDVPIVRSTKFPATVMVLRVISNEGDVMLPYIFPKGLRVKTKEYLQVLDEVVKPWMDEIARGHHYVFQQDGHQPISARRPRTGVGLTSRSSGGRTSGLPARRTVTLGLFHVGHR
jgi:hypothetical protein